MVKEVTMMKEKKVNLIHNTGNEKMDAMETEIDLLVQILAELKKLNEVKK